MSTTAEFLVSRVAVLTIASMLENSYRTDAFEVEGTPKGVPVSDEKDTDMRVERLKRLLKNEEPGKTVLLNEIMEEWKKIKKNKTQEFRTPPLPAGYERVTEVSQYLSSDSVSFYSHEDTPSERLVVAGHPESSYSFEVETENVIDPHNIVQILHTKCLDPYLAYKAVAAEHELLPQQRKLVWDKIFLYPVSVYRALMNFKSTRENIYKSLKKAKELKLFTAPPKELWNALHNEDPLMDERLKRSLTTRGKRKPTVSPGDKAAVERFKQQARRVGRILKDNNINCMLAFEMCRAQTNANPAEAKMIFKQFGLDPESVYNVTVAALKMSRLQVLRSLNYLTHTVELFKKPLGAKPEHDGALHPELYEQALAMSSEEDVEIMETYMKYTPRSTITVQKFV